jgi:PIN domain nuclease of toxin-antitoxin system
MWATTSVSRIVRGLQNKQRRWLSVDSQRVADRLVYPPTASSITEDDRKRIYFHSAGNWELFLAHSLGSLPNPPPMTFLI